MTGGSFLRDGHARREDGVEPPRSTPSRRARSGRLLLGSLLALACLFPFGYLLFATVAGGPGWTLERWRSVLGGTGNLGESFVLSMGISLLVATISTAGGWLAAKHLAGHARRHALLRLAYFPFAMSPVILGACLLHLALRAGVSGGAAGVIVAQTIFCWGFAIVFFEGFWSARLRALEELVRSLGGGTGDLYRLVLLPLSREVLQLGFLQTFLLSWFQYGLTLLIGAGKVQTLTLRVYSLVGEANPHYAAVASCLVVAPPALLLLLNRRLLARMA